MCKIKVFAFFAIFSSLSLSCELKQLSSVYDSQYSPGTYSGDGYRIVKLVDGDTFWVEDGDSHRIKVRLIGIDAPEARNAFKKKKHPFGAESKAYLGKMVENSPYINLTFDVDRTDAYGRTLAYAFLPDGTMINERMVRDGYAILMTYPPNIKYEQKLRDAQKKARESNLGIWAIPVFE
ncbi:micrococcal nuclease [Sphingobacterium nematocida]|uniref:Micrococcal nuclease n=1 Tax=Sphingobacterium nematocida TaxID=1513896 RepID=A0A1T5GI81_9SPHI|nr:thermonuclease family protein [Sphingobacterium nematocida]SKC08037.1 micrococcal nuclease [Sphingobacterium nematocida]